MSPSRALVVAPLLVGTLAVAMPAMGQEPQAKSSRPMPDSLVPWPELPRSGFIRGRAAHQADVDADNAVFVAAAGGQSIGQPLSIPIPQYAIYRDSAAGRDVRVIVVQAESARGNDIVGFRDIVTGQEGMALLRELRLLGTTRPSHP